MLFFLVMASEIPPCQGKEGQFSLTGVKLIVVGWLECHSGCKNNCRSVFATSWRDYRMVFGIGEDLSTGPQVYVICL